MEAVSTQSQDGHSTVGRHLLRTLPARPESAGVARRAVAELIGGDASADRRDAVLLAVSEAVTNVVVHAYEGADGAVSLFAIVVGDQLILSVDDDGRGLAAPTRTPGLGMGLRLIRDAADDSLLGPGPRGGTSVQCRFSLRDHGGRDDDQVRRSAA